MESSWEMDRAGLLNPSGRLAVRAACRWLRDAFDSWNNHLVLVGAMLAEPRCSSPSIRSYHALLRRLLSRTSNLRSLRIKDITRACDCCLCGTLLELQVPWGRLVRLDLSYRSGGAMGRSGEALEPLGLCSALQELTAPSRCLFSGKIGVLPFSTTLRSLHLASPSSADLPGVATLFPALQQLELQQDCEEPPLNLSGLAACAGLCQLEVVPYRRDGSIKSSLDSMPPLTQLTHLAFTGAVDIEGLQPLVPLSSLRRLELHNCTSITDVSPLASLNLLEHLDLSGCSRVCSLSPLSSCTLLGHLDLSRSQAASRPGGLQPLTSCTGLRKLVLRSCRDLTALLVPLPSLEELDPCGCEELRDLSALTACTSLSSLDLSRCPRVSCLAPLSVCGRLRSLKLARCCSVTSLEQLGTCTSLRRLDLHGCARVEDLAPLAACRHLEELNLRACNAIGSLEPLASCVALKRMSLAFLAKALDLAPLAACKALRCLDLRGCCAGTDLTPLRSCNHIETLTLPTHYGVV